MIIKRDNYKKITLYIKDNIIIFQNYKMNHIVGYILINDNEIQFYKSKYIEEEYMNKMIIYNVKNYRISGPYIWSIRLRIYRPLFTFLYFGNFYIFVF